MPQSHQSEEELRAELQVLHRRMDERTARLEHINDTLRSEIRRRQKVELDLLEKQRLLEFSNFELEQFATVASHDLQEPLRMVSSYVRLIERRFGGQLGQDGEDFIRFAAEGAERMKVLINSLASYARMDRGAQPFTKVDLTSITRDAIDDLRMRIKEAGAEIDLSDLGSVMGDHTQLTQLFSNLLTNALKYRGQEPLKITISAHTNAGEKIISVADNGIGIPERDLERVFLVFRQVDRASRPHGSGIGLAIVKKIAVRHGGRVWAESRLGQGTTFKIALPAPNQEY